MVFIGVAASAGIAWLVCAIAVRVGPLIGYVDPPDDTELKVHDVPAVPLGGVAVFSGMVVGWLAAGTVIWGLTGLMATIVLLGLLDDRIGLPPLVRLAAEAAVGIATLSLGLVPLEIGSPLQAMFGVALVMVAVNAVNLLDGLDGLAASTALIAFLGITALSISRGLDAALPLIAASALVGFLFYNRHPARVFLGDNGAYLVGFVLAVTVMRSSADGLGEQLWISTLTLGVFAFDLAATVLRRRRAGKPLLAGDRRHLYDQLRDHGWSIPAVVAAAAGAQTVFVSVALGLELMR